MRDLVVTENITVDGVIAPMDGWFDPAAQDEDLVATNAEHRDAADALVLGRITYQDFAAYWPAQVDDPTGISDYLNGVSKYVVSASLDRADWENTTILRGPVEQELAALKRLPGRDIVVTGSASLAQPLVTSGLVDVVRLFVYPVVQGHGRRLFDGPMPGGLTLVDTRTFASGIVLLAYRSMASPSAA
ncbi:dihydrofolate reductase family protein [Rugosimonospora africana]|uniref:Dihydrofolate reductase n=1 Tax=Rugosimonospora africana TaxID=556532 RepID=A0A8J3VVJ5_9ACTN|nr:dihydrofolate reductase family protein [Rugosimonospora africana]GIH20727.1 dihydrofolate reductase [Rugosimonospora africana]